MKRNRSLYKGLNKNSNISFSLSNWKSFFEKQYTEWKENKSNTKNPQKLNSSKIKFQFKGKPIKLEWLLPQDKMEMEPVSGVFKIAHDVMEHFKTNFPGDYQKKEEFLVFFDFKDIILKK